jgi:hypothetical protein
VGHPRPTGESDLAPMKYPTGVTDNSSMYFCYLALAPAVIFKVFYTIASRELCAPRCLQSMSGEILTGATCGFNKLNNFIRQVSLFSFLVIKSFVCLFHCSSFDIKIKP